MMMLECDAKQLLASVGVNVPAGTVWRRGAAAGGVTVDHYPVAVKAQVRSGGRGKQGGVVKVTDRAALEAAAKKLFDIDFGGEKPDALLIEPWLAIERECYLSVAVDGRAEGYVVLYSPLGGMDIEDGAPPVRYEVGAPWNFRVHRLREILEKVEPDYQWREKVIALAQRLVRTAAAQDCTTIEINPLVKLSDGALIAADAKVARDEWAHFRNAEINAEREAEKGRADPYLRACLDMQHMYVKLDRDGHDRRTWWTSGLLFGLQPGTDLDTRLPSGLRNARRRSGGESDPRQRLWRRHPDAARGQLDERGHGRTQKREACGLPA